MSIEIRFCFFLVLLGIGFLSTNGQIQVQDYELVDALVNKIISQNTSISAVASNCTPAAFACNNIGKCIEGFQHLTPSVQLLSLSFFVSFFFF